MPAKSARQYRLMQAVAHGRAHLKSLTPEQAQEFVSKTPAKKRKLFAARKRRA